MTALLELVLSSLIGLHGFGVQELRLLRLLRTLKLVRSWRSLRTVTPYLRHHFGRPIAPVSYRITTWSLSVCLASALSLP